MRSKLLALSLLAAAGSPLAAQSDAITGTIRKTGFDPVKIGIPDANAAATASDAAREIVDTLRADLEFSEFFDVVDPRLYRLVATGSAGEVRHEDWVSIGAEHCRLPPSSSFSGSKDGYSP